MNHNKSKKKLEEKIPEHEGKSNYFYSHPSITPISKKKKLKEQPFSPFLIIFYELGLNNRSLMKGFSSSRFYKRYKKKGEIFLDFFEKLEINLQRK